MDPDLQAKLAKLDADFREAPIDGGAFSLPEPGDYQAVLKSIDTFEGKKDDTQYLKLTYEIAHDAVYEGREVDMVYTWIPDESLPEEDVRKRLGFLKRDLQTLGVDTDAEDFSYTVIYPGSEFWDGLLDVPVELAIRDSKKINQETGQPYRNVFLNERLGGPLHPSDVTPPVESVAPVAASVADDDDIPF